jgi:hemerythrin-like metal-binding protein
MIIQWDKKMETGIPFLDADHIKLLGIINDIHDEIISKSVDSKKLHKLFIDIIMYGVYHFNNEEALFKEFEVIAKFLKQPHLLADATYFSNQQAFC